MADLILAKHAMPEIVPGVPGREWRLSAEGRRRSRDLAARLAPYQPSALVTSSEPKAQETGEIAADALGLAVETMPDLHENDRTGLAYTSAEDWQAMIARFFAAPDELVMGRETADQAYARFEAAVAAVAARHTGTAAIVAHGTVITLLVSRLTGVPPLPLWESLGLPSFVVLRRPDMELVRVVARMDEF
ncbi:MAG: histidine phosphatase family protein [Chloroflexia bacterium]